MKFKQGDVVKLINFRYGNLKNNSLGEIYSEYPAAYVVIFNLNDRVLMYEKYLCKATEREIFLYHIHGSGALLNEV